MGIIENEESHLLDNINYLKFLVIDEAETQTGHFLELKNVVPHIYNRIEIKDNEEKIMLKIKLIILIL